MALKIAHSKRNAEAVILKNAEALAPAIDIKILADDIIEKITAFDWLDLGAAKNEADFAAIIANIFKRFNFAYPARFDPAIRAAFLPRFLQAVEVIKRTIEAVDKSYNVPEASKGFQNAEINRFYYIDYWANKKVIPVNHNEKNEEKRALFNLDTILLCILADKLAVLNEYERTKTKKK